MIAPLGSAPFQLAPDDVQSDGGHPEQEYRPLAGSRSARLIRAWVEFLVQDAGGKEIYHSGFLKPDGSLDERAHSFTNRPVNLDGDFVDNHKVWTIHSVAYDNTIQSGRSALVRYEFRIPADAKGPLTVTARVNYRHLRQSYLNNIFGPDHPAYPVVELASRTRTLNIGDNPVRLRTRRIIRTGCAGTIWASPTWINCNTPTPCTPSSKWSSCGRIMPTATSISA